MADGINHIRLEYEAKNLDKILRDTKSVEQQNELIIDMLGKFNQALADLTGNTSKAATALRKEYTEAVKTCNEALSHFSSDASKVLQKVANDSVKVQKEQAKAVKAAASKESMESLVKDLEKLTKKYQDNVRHIEKSKESLLKGKKDTPLETSYLIQEQKEIQKQIKKTKADIVSLYRTYDGAKATGSRAISHSEDAINFTEQNVKQRHARDILTQTLPMYKQQLETYREMSKLYGEEAQSTREAKEQLESTITLRERQKQILTDTRQELIEAQKLELDIGQDVLNRNEQAEKEIQNALTIKNLKKEDAAATKELLESYKKLYEIEDKIEKLSTNAKGKKSEVSKMQHKNEIAALQEQGTAIKKNVADLEKQYNIRGKNLEKIKQQAREEDNARRITDAHNKDLQSQGKMLDETLKNFMKFTVYYQGLRLLKQGIQEALDTMKELDKAMTDVRLVTGGSKEETAQLAKEYNQLAKEMGATTTAVAEGAGEWFNESRDHLKVLELLETREG